MYKATLKIVAKMVVVNAQTDDLVVTRKLGNNDIIDLALGRALGTKVDGKTEILAGAAPMPITRRNRPRSSSIRPRTAWVLSGFCRRALVIVSARESIVGVHEFVPGLGRYALGILLLGPCWLTLTLLAFTLSCWEVKPGAATVVALAILHADNLLRVQPGLAAFAPYSVTTRILTWRHAFSYEIPWLRIERNLGQLLALDLVLIVLAWWVFRRRELAP